MLIQQKFWLCTTMAIRWEKRSKEKGKFIHAHRERIAWPELECKRGTDVTLPHPFVNGMNRWFCKLRNECDAVGLQSCTRSSSIYNSCSIRIAATDGVQPEWWKWSGPASDFNDLRILFSSETRIKSREAKDERSILTKDQNPWRDA